MSYDLTPLRSPRSPSQPSRGREIGYLGMRTRLDQTLVQVRTDSGCGAASGRTGPTGRRASPGYTGPCRRRRRRTAVPGWRWRRGRLGTPLLPGKMSLDHLFCCSRKPHLRRKQEVSCSRRKTDRTEMNGILEVFSKSWKNSRNVRMWNNRRNQRRKSDVYVEDKQTLTQVPLIQISNLLFQNSRKAVSAPVHEPFCGSVSVCCVLSTETRRVKITNDSLMAEDPLVQTSCWT